MVETRAFIIGCARSGTSLLRDLLRAHPDITAFPESHFFPHLEASQPLARRLGVASGRAPKALARFQDKLGQPIRPPRLRLVRSYGRAFVKLLDGLTDTPVWVEKTPRHLSYIDLIERTVPRPRFIHIVRSGEDVVASIYELTQKGPQPWWGKQFQSLDDCLDEWLKAVQITWRYRTGRNHVTVRYEDLVTDPELELHRVCDFLGVPFTRMMTEGFELRNERRAKFYSLFTEEQQSYILKRLDTQG
jgi:hypothetical protein